MPPVHRYCPGCNEKFLMNDDEHHCPQCSQNLADEELAATVDFDLEHGHDTHLEGLVGTDATQVSDWIGREFDHYRIDGVAGHGGMAWVFRAFHQSLQRNCAIKVLSGERIRKQPEIVNHFLTEARAAASLIHPNIVTVHNVGQIDANHYIELEYVGGSSLLQVAKSSGPLHPRLATDFMLQTCNALSLAHESGLIHRDLKPANILITENKVAKLSDFGLAKRIAQDSPRPGQGIAGTPYYMAPELFQGSPASRRSDFYAMGVTYFLLLTGRLPFSADSVSGLARKHAIAAIPDPTERVPAAPKQAGEFIRRCLAKDPAERFGCCDEMTEMLLSIARNLRDLNTLVDEALRGLDCDAEKAGERHVVKVPLEGGRSQTVYVEEQESSQQLIRIFSVCAAAVPGFYERALELNTIIPFGSLAIQHLCGEPHFVMLNSYPRGTCDPEEIRHSILDIARWADDIEKQLTGRDRN